MSTTWTRLVNIIIEEKIQYYTRRVNMIDNLRIQK